MDVVKVIVDARNVDVVVLVQEKVALMVKIHSEIKVILIQHFCRFFYVILLYMYYISGRSSSNFREYLQRCLGEIKQKQRTKAGPSTAKYGMKLKGPNNQRLGSYLT